MDRTMAGRVLRQVNTRTGQVRMATTRTTTLTTAGIIDDEPDQRRCRFNTSAKRDSTDNATVRDKIDATQDIDGRRARCARPICTSVILVHHRQYDGDREQLCWRR